MRNILLSAIVVAMSVVTLQSAEPVATIRGDLLRISDDLANADILLTLDGARIVDVELYDSSISLFRSDKGDDLGAKPEGMPEYGAMPVYYSVENTSGWGDEPLEQRKITITSPKKLSAGVASVNLAGELVFDVADVLETNVIQNMAIQDGGAVEIHGVKGVIKEVKRGEEDMEFRVDLSDVPEGFEFEDIELKNAAGDELRGSRNTQKMKFGDGPETMNLWFYGVKPVVDSVTFEYFVWKNRRTLRVPYDVTVSTTKSEAPASVVSPSTPAPVADPTKRVMRRDASSPAVTAPPAESTTSSGWPSVKISGIAGKGASGTVFIDGSMLKVGGTIPGSNVKVKSIDSGRVILVLGTEEKTFRPGEMVK